MLDLVGSSCAIVCQDGAVNGCLGMQRSVVQGCLHAATSHILASVADLPSPCPSHTPFGPQLIYPALQRPEIHQSSSGMAHALCGECVLRSIMSSGRRTPYELATFLETSRGRCYVCLGVEHSGSISHRPAGTPCVLCAAV